MDHVIYLLPCYDYLHDVSDYIFTSLLCQILLLFLLKALKFSIIIINSCQDLHDMHAFLSSKVNKVHCKESKKCHAK